MADHSDNYGEDEKYYMNYGTHGLHGQLQQQQQQQIDDQCSYGIMMQPTSSSFARENFISPKNDGDHYNLVGGEEMDDQNPFLYLDQEPYFVHDRQIQNYSSHIPPSHNSFSSDLDMQVDPSFVGESLASSANTGKEMRVEVTQEVNIRNDTPMSSLRSEHGEGPKTPDPKIMRRLAQNRKAARKSRLRKKAYVQELEYSRMKLVQLEQELQTARAQGIFLRGGTQRQCMAPDINNISSDARLFDMECRKWEEDCHRLLLEMRIAMEKSPEEELRVLVDKYIIHYEEMAKLKSMAIKSDIFHIISGAWRTPVERCILWMGGFRPSNLIKIVLKTNDNFREALSQKQMTTLYELQGSVQETETRINQGVEALYQFLSDGIASDALIARSSLSIDKAKYMDQMAIAMNKLSTLEGYVTQAEKLRQKTVHWLNQILSTHQAARFFVAISDYIYTLRHLSSLWLLARSSSSSQVRSRSSPPWRDDTLGDSTKFV